MKEDLNRHLRLGISRFEQAVIDFKPKKDSPYDLYQAATSLGSDYTTVKVLGGVPFELRARAIHVLRTGALLVPRGSDPRIRQSIVDEADEIEQTIDFPSKST